MIHIEGIILLISMNPSCIIHHSTHLILIRSLWRLHCSSTSINWTNVTSSLIISASHNFVWQILRLKFSFESSNFVTILVINKPRFLIKRLLKHIYYVILYIVLNLFLLTNSVSLHLIEIFSSILC